MIYATMNPRMMQGGAEVESKTTVEFKADPQRVWDVVTDNEHTGWRSDVQTVEIQGDKAFIERTPQGHETRFTITEKQPCKAYAFTMENKMFTGQWRGDFEALPDGGCRITFFESVRMRNPIARLLAPLLLNLPKMQQAYMRDLRRELGE